MPIAGVSLGMNSNLSEENIQALKLLTEAAAVNLENLTTQTREQLAMDLRTSWIGMSATYSNDEGMDRLAGITSAFAGWVSGVSVIVDNPNGQDAGKTLVNCCTEITNIMNNNRPRNNYLEQMRLIVLVLSRVLDKLEAVK